MKTTFKAWISKYALTTGIFEVEVEDCFSIDPNMVAARTPDYPTQNFHKGDWHRTRDEAAAKAEQIRTKKIASLQSQIKKLEGMKF